jgi:hypothetical protein
MNWKEKMLESRKEEKQNTGDETTKNRKTW